MTPPTFRLAVVERLRAAQLTEAERALSRAQHSLAEARAHGQVLTDRLLGCAPDGDAPGADERAATELFTAGERREQLREEITAADVQQAELAQQAEQARQAWVSARARLRAVESLHERHRVAVRRERDRRDQRATDDLAASRRHGPDRATDQHGPTRGTDQHGPNRGTDQHGPTRATDQHDPTRGTPVGPQGTGRDGGEVA